MLPQEFIPDELSLFLWLFMVKHAWFFILLILACIIVTPAALLLILHRMGLLLQDLRIRREIETAGIPEHLGPGAELDESVRLANAQFVQPEPCFCPLSNQRSCTVWPSIFARASAPFSSTNSSHSSDVIIPACGACFVPRWL